MIDNQGGQAASYRDEGSIPFTRSIHNQIHYECVQYKCSKMDVDSPIFSFLDSA